MLAELSLQFPQREKLFIALSLVLLTSIAIDQIILWTDEYEPPEEVVKPLRQPQEDSKAETTSLRALSDKELYNLSQVSVMNEHDHLVLPIAQHSEMAFSTGLVF